MDNESDNSEEDINTNIEDYSDFIEKKYTPFLLEKTNSNDGNSYEDSAMNMFELCNKLLKESYSFDEIKNSLNWLFKNTLLYFEEV